MDMRRRKGKRKEEGQSRIVIPTKPSALIIFGNEARRARVEREKAMDEIPPPLLSLSPSFTPDHSIACSKDICGYENR